MISDNRPSWDQLREQAADWLAGMDSGTADREEFEAWRGADPRHAVAFVQVANALGALDRAKPALRGTFPTAKKSSRRAFLWAGAGIAVAVAAAGAFEVATAKTTLVTRVGERKQVRLSAGASIAVNTDTRIQWHDRKILEVWLEKGEVALDLTASPQLCRLHAAGHIAEFAGSRINARLRGSLLDLAVVKGTCGLTIEKGTNTAKLADGKRMVVPASHAVLASAAQAVVRPLDAIDTASLEGWPNGELVFQGQTLDTAVAEYNRYLDRKIVIADAPLAEIRLGGRFTTQDPEAFLNALHGSFGIRVVDDGVGSIALTK